MQYRYTVRGGYDRLLKKKVEKGTLFAVPIAIMVIVGLAALTSNTTTGPGIGSSSKGNSGQSTVTKSFQTTAANDQTGGGGASSTTSGTSTQGGTSSSSVASAGAATTSALQPSSGTTSAAPTSTSTPPTGSTTAPSSGDTTIVPPAPIPTPPVTVCTKIPVTLCIN